jgi:hypothetical protein
MTCVLSKELEHVHRVGYVKTAEGGLYIATNFYIIYPQ